MRDRPSDTAHRRAAEAKLGRKLRSDELVHHRDQDKSNQASSNLDVKTRSDHTAEHNQPGQRRLGRLRKALDIVSRNGNKLY